MNAVTSSSTGATQRSGGENAPIKVVWLACSYIFKVTGTPAASSFAARLRVLRVGLTSESLTGAARKLRGAAADGNSIGCARSG